MVLLSSCQTQMQPKADYQQPYYAWIGDGQATFEGAKRVTIPYSEAPYCLHGHPGIEASINGVSGLFMIDTGTVAPMLSRQAVRLCSLNVGPSSGKWWNGESAAPMEVATNVTVWLTPRFAIHWSGVAVLSEEHKADTNFFGFLDYGTLQAAHAVMDMKKKTITLNQ